MSISDSAALDPTKTTVATSGETAVAFADYLNEGLPDPLLKWQWITLFSVCTSGILYFVTGIVLSWVVGRFAVLWVPLITAIVGGLYGLIVGAPSALVLTYMYESANFPMTPVNAATFGVTIAVLIFYLQLGRNDSRLNDRG